MAEKNNRIQQDESDYDHSSDSYNDEPKNLGKEEQVLSTLSKADNGKSKLSLRNIKKKPLILGGSGVAIIISLIFSFNFIGVFQLMHLDGFISGKMDARTKRIIDRRAAAHYSAIFDEEGKGYYAKNGIRGVISERYSSLSPGKIVEDLRSKGYDVSINEQGRLIMNGEELTGDRADKRRQLVNILNEEYPNDGFIKRYKRTQATFKTFGIKRSFFENTKEKVDNWELRTIKKIRDRLGIGSTKASVAGETKNNTPLTDESGVQRDSIEGIDPEEINAGAAAEAEKLKDPKYIPPDIDTGGASAQVDSIAIDLNSASSSAGDLAAGVSPILVGSFKVTGALDAACEVKYWIKAVELGSKAYRYSALIQYSTTIMVASQQLKTGKSVSSAEVGGLMKMLNRDPGIGASGAYRTLAGESAAEIKGVDKYGLTFNTGAGGVFSKVNSFIDSTLNPGGATEDYCKVSQNVAFQAGSIVVGVGAAIFTAGGTFVANFIAQAIKSLAINVAGELVKPMLIQSIAGGVINGYESGDEVGDALVAGSAILASSQRFQLGAPKISPEEVSIIENQINIERIAENKNKSIYDKYFNPTNYDSIAFKTLMRFPSSPEGMNRELKNSASNIAKLPTKFFNFKAQANDGLTGTAKVLSDFGIQDYGWTDEQVDKMGDPREIESWIDENGLKEAYQKWANKCKISSGSEGNLTSVGVAIDQPGENLLKECEDEDNKVGNRYSFHYLDRALSTAIAFNSQQSDCLNPDSEEWDCAYEDGGNPERASSDGSSGGTTTLPTGSDAEIIEKLLNEPNIQWADPEARRDVQRYNDPQINRVLLSLAQSSGHKIVITDSYRPGANDFHGQGKALDIDDDSKSGPNYNPKSDELFKFIYDNREIYKLNKLIWADPPPGTNCIDSSGPGNRRLGSCLELYGAGTTAQHNNHIHLAVD